MSRKGKGTYSWEEKWREKKPETTKRDGKSWMLWQRLDCVKVNHQGLSPGLGETRSTADILTKSPTGVLYEVFGKSDSRRGKMGERERKCLSKRALSLYSSLVFRFWKCQPQFWIIPAKGAEHMKQPWFNESYAIFCSNKEHRTRIEPYKDAWHYLSSKQPLHKDYNKACYCLRLRR